MDLEGVRDFFLDLRGLGIFFKVWLGGNGREGFFRGFLRILIGRG